jgi:urocanate hydratase
VRKSLIRQVEAINKLVQKGLRFWDYGNSFMLESSRAGADIWEVKVKIYYFIYIYYLFFLEKFNI